jgi:Mrp family chromosome partitioning ATPase/uncharacterized protein involved in exopolysaccharide biosynthesis
MMMETAPKEALPFGKPNKPLDLFGFIKRYGLFILGIGAFLFTLTVPIVLLISKPNFEVRALMRIDPVIPSVITKSEDPSIINYYSDYSNTQSRRMMDFENLKKTVEKLTPEQKNSIFYDGLPTKVCAEILGNMIKVSPVPGTHLLELTISGPKKKGLAPVLNNLMQIYLDKVRNSNQMEDNERLDYLRNEKEALSNDIATIEEKLNILTREISTADFAESYNMANKKAGELQQISVNALYDRITAQNRFGEVQQNNQALLRVSLDPMVEERVRGDQSLNSTSSWTYQQQQQLRSSTEGLSSGNPDRIFVEERMKAMSDYEKKLQYEVRSSARQIVYGKRDYEQKKELLQSKFKAENARNTETEVLRELENAKNESVRISLGLHLGESLKANLKHKRDLLDQIDTRIHELELEGKAPLHIAIESFAREPDAPAGSNTKKLMIVFFGLSFGSVFVLFFGVEFFDNRIRRQEEVRHALGYPPAKEITKSKSGAPFHQLFDHDPDGVTARTIRSLAVKFMHEKKEHHSQVLLFSASEHGAGTTSICLNCARALAMLVPKVLLLEAVKNTPPLDALMESGAPSGFTELLRSTASADDCIVRGLNGLPDTICFGNPTGGSALPQQHITDVMQQLRGIYDIICIDAAPVLESSLTEHLALHTDLVVLVVHGDNSMYRDLRAAAEAFVRLEVPAIAPILNRNTESKPISIDKLLEERPVFLDKIGLGKLEAIINRYPPALRALNLLKQKIIALAVMTRSEAERPPEKQSKT